MVTKNETIVMGDFNINFKSDTANAKKLKNIIADAGFQQIVKDDTRVTKTSSTLIDVIVTNNFTLEELPRSMPILSDHDIIGTQIKIENDSQTEYIYRRDFSKENIDKLKVDLIGKTWETSSTDVNELYTNLIENITSSVNMICPVIEVKVNSRPWINKNVRSAQKLRDTAHKKFVISKSAEDYEDYKKKRNQVTCMIRQEKKKYYESNVDNAKGDSKKMWRTMKNLISGKKKDQIRQDQIIFDGYTDELEENFNKYYCDSIKEIADSIDNRTLRPTDSWEFNESDIPNFGKISLNKLHKIICDLKNKSTSDECLNVKLLKDLFCVIGYPLLNIINVSLETGRVPSALKVSVIVPIAKVSLPTRPEHCRPINLLPVIDKLLEIIVCEQLRAYFEENNLLFAGQSGFREGHSCETALQYVCASWRKDIGEGNIVVTVFVDLKRAFETIDRNLLISKLEKYGVKSVALNWIKDYLQDRYHKTKINNKISNSVISQFGVPQGSVLGPLLFVIYVNDIYSVLKNSFINLFADDTLISVSGKNFEYVANTLNEELDILYDWLCSNKLKLNSEKTKYMALGSKANCMKYLSQNLPVKINNIPVENVMEFKYLGVILDPQLNFGLQVDYVCKKLGKKIGFFHRASLYLSQWSRILVYNTIIYHHFNYCTSMLISCNKTELNRMQLLQNKCMRIILNCNIYTPVKNMLNTLNWLSVEQNIKKANMVLIYKIVKQMVPKYLQIFLKKRYDLHSRNIRTKNNFNIEFVNKSFLQGSLFYEGVRQFNDLPSHIKEATNLNVFVREVCNYLAYCEN